MENNTKNLSNFKALCQTLVKYRVINPREKESPEEACANFLRKGEKIALPTSVFIPSKDGDPNGGRYMPYRIFPTAAIEALNQSVRFLEYCLQRDNTPDRIEPEFRTNPYNDPEIRKGALQLANLLAPNCLITPETENFNSYRSNTPEDAGGGTLLHRANPKDPEKPILTKRAKILKGLLGRLEKYESIRLALLPNPLETSPELQEIQQINHLFNQEVKASVHAWRTLRDEIQEKTKSIEDMSFSEGQKALEDSSNNEPADAEHSDFSSYDPEDDPLDQEEFHQDQLQAAHYYGDSAETNEEEENPSQKTRKNLPCEPTGWLWQEAIDPMEFITSYLSEEINPLIDEKKEKIISQFTKKNLSQKEKEEELLIIPEKKYNPNDFWKLLQNLAKNTPEENQTLREKLASARFAVCLRETNHQIGIPHKEFLEAWEKTTREHISGKNLKPSRNHALFGTLKSLKTCADWTPEKLDQWMETLQTMAPGGYENTQSQETNRRQILNSINKTLLKLKESIEETQGNEPTKEVEFLLKEVSKGITKSLTGPTGQTVRRELRYHIKSLKDQAESRKETAQANNLKSFWQWITSISGKIKSGEWFTPDAQETNQKIVQSMLLEIISEEIGKDKTNIISLSPEPTGKNELELCIDFTKAISKDNASRGFAGRSQIDSKIKEAITNLQESRQKNLGTTLPAKIWNKTQNTEDLPNKIRADLEAERLLKTLPENGGNIQNLFRETENHLNALFNQLEENSKNPNQTPISEEQNLAFFEGMLSICENIRRRKEKPQFQPSALGRRMLKTYAKLAKDKYTGNSSSPEQSASMQRNSRRMVLLSHAIAPIGLWILAPLKGKNKDIPHKDIIQSFSERRQRREEILKLFSQDNQKNFKDQLEKELIISFSINLSSLDKIKEFCQNPKELAQSIIWQHRHEEETLLMAEKYPEKDSPLQRFEIHQNGKNPKNPSQIKNTNQEVEQEVA